MTRVTAAIKGELRKRMAEEARFIEGAQRTAVARATRIAQLRIRKVINDAFGGSERQGGRGNNTRVANTIRSKIYPGFRGGFVGVIWSRFGKKEAGQFIDYLIPFVEGATLRPRGKYLRIQLAKSFAGVRGSGGRRSASLGKQRVVYRDPSIFTIKLKGGAILVLEKRKRAKPRPLELLVPKVRLPKKLDFAEPLRRAGDELPEELMKALEADTLTGARRFAG